MPAVKYSQSYTNTEYKEEAKSSFKTLPIKKNTTKPIPSKKQLNSSNSTKLNFALLTVGAFFTICFIAIYSIVALSETKLANLHTKISELNYENIELENKLENVKSYYSVDTKVSNTADFEKAKNVLEVNHVGIKTTEHKKTKNSNLNTVTGF